MPLNMSDPIVVAEVQPPTVIDLGNLLKAHYGVGSSNFGIKGDENHLSGYHRSRNTLVNVPGASGSGDYSIQNTLDTVNMSWNDCSACDMTPHQWGSTENNQRMIDGTNRMYTAAKKYDPRIQQCREFAGTFDGVNVVRFRCDGGAIQSPFDSSHLEHWHISFWRSRVRWNHSGLFEVLTGSDGDDDMIFLVSDTSGIVWASENKQTRRRLVDTDDLNDYRTQATNGTMKVWANGTILSVPSGKLYMWGEDITTPEQVELADANIEEIKQAAREGAQDGSGGLTFEETEQAAFEGAQRAEDS